MQADEFVDCQHTLRMKGETPEEIAGNEAVQEAYLGKSAA